MRAAQPEDRGQRTRFCHCSRLDIMHQLCAARRGTKDRSSRFPRRSRRGRSVPVYPVRVTAAIMSLNSPGLYSVLELREASDSRIRARGGGALSTSLSPLVHSPIRSFPVPRSPFNDIPQKESAGVDARAPTEDEDPCRNRKLPASCSPWDQARPPLISAEQNRNVRATIPASL
ncbi:hypothetical protein L226DRAFT_312079 [Lentinus tigrinus ALCF2SS1-7]|uniref:uncharacterized protein n=1 Tax=Lentinus tigrinus ALCF2SS1-7 TaxID=1328758 RepID=UPI00116636E3|nr:hypothetical protein L226DRAFT_312079 [Lentinus tigrinus ALCF2SS1-7]